MTTPVGRGRVFFNGPPGLSTTPFTTPVFSVAKDEQIFVTPTGDGLSEIDIQILDPLGHWLTMPTTGAAGDGVTYPFSNAGVPPGAICRLILTPTAGGGTVICWVG